MHELESTRAIALGKLAHLSQDLLRSLEPKTAPEEVIGRTERARVWTSAAELQCERRLPVDVMIEMVEREGQLRQVGKGSHGMLADLAFVTKGQAVSFRDVAASRQAIQKVREA